MKWVVPSETALMVSGQAAMNIYAIFVEGKSTIYVRASYSDQAVRFVEERQRCRVSAWDVAICRPAGSVVFNHWDGSIYE